MMSYSEEEYYYKLDSMMLAACQHVRKTFKLRFKEESGGEWVDHNETRLRFVQGIGNEIYKKAPTFQKSALKNKSVEEWDISLLWLVIQNFGAHSKYEQENSAVWKLKKLRNKLAHHCSKKISKDEFENDAEIFKSCLLNLGMKENDIDALIQKAGVASSQQALELMEELLGLAERHLKNGDVAKATECYTSAVEIPSLLPVNLATVYEKRANSFLQQVQNPLTDLEKCNQALMDANKALDLNDSSWMAHYLAAQCYRWKNELPQAIHHYQRAHAISPGQTIVRQDLESCRLLFVDYSRGNNFSTSDLYMSLEECLQDLEDQSGIKFTEEEFFYNKEVDALLLDGQGDAFRGHTYFYGWKKPQDFSQAFKYYSKSAEVKNTEGMYNVARCYIYGHGVEQDFQKAFQICSELAEMDRNSPGPITPYQCNHWIATAQEALGLMYKTGTGVMKNFSQSARWFRRSMDNGHGRSATQLGNYYFAGVVVPQDRKMAELCWKQALYLSDCCAPYNLMQYYLDEMEPEKALVMFNIARELRNPRALRMSEQDFTRLVEKGKSARAEMEPLLIEFEKVHKLEAKGLTFKQRFVRLKHPSVAKLHALMRKSLEGNPGQPESWGGKLQRMNSNIVLEIAQRAAQGSQTASNASMALSCFAELQRTLKCNTKFSNEHVRILNVLYTCFTLGHNLLVIPENVATKLRIIITKMFEERCEHDMKARLCFVVLHFGESEICDDMQLIELLKEGIARYPTNVHYYYFLTALLEGKRKVAEVRHYAEEGLKRFPDNPDLLFRRACHMPSTAAEAYMKLILNTTSLLDSQPGFRSKADILKNMPRVDASITIGEIKDRIHAYEHYLKIAPVDHRKYPEGYYAISGMYITQQMYKGYSEESELDLAKIYFRRGVESEEHQLPCYLPYGKSGVKDFVQAFLDSREVLANPHLKPESPKQMTVLERKVYLNSLSRKTIIVLHRKVLSMCGKAMQPSGSKNYFTNIYSGFTIPAKLDPMMVVNMSLVTSITLIEMNPTKDDIFKNRVIDLTIIDEPNPYYRSIHLIVEDENGDATQLFVYNVDRSTGTLDNFRPGCRVAIINPYLRIGALDKSVGIRVDDPRCIVYLQKLKTTCRFCGEENATRKCSKCKRPYCSRECQTLDWKEFNHKLICPYTF